LVNGQNPQRLFNMTGHSSVIRILRGTNVSRSNACRTKDAELGSELM
jgi:hypothetical protein